MEDEKKTMINNIPAEAFLVRDKSLTDIDAPFYKWLRKNGFRHAWHKGHYDNCSWAFVNITHKLFAYGMPGVGIVKPIGNHAITLEEFFRIYEIYEKYEGLELMCFTKEEQKERHTVRFFIRTFDPEERRNLIEILEKEGFRIESDGITTREKIIGSGFPVMVNKTDKALGVVQDSAQTAELEKLGRIMDIEEFYVYYKGPKCSYDEYFTAVKKKYIRCYARSTDDAERVFDEGKEDLIKGYNEYIAGHHVGNTPSDMVWFLFMQY